MTCFDNVGQRIIGMEAGKLMAFQVSLFVETTVWFAEQTAQGTDKYNEILGRTIGTTLNFECVSRWQEFQVSDEGVYVETVVTYFQGVGKPVIDVQNIHELVYVEECQDLLAKLESGL